MQIKGLLNNGNFNDIIEITNDKYLTNDEIVIRYIALLNSCFDDSELFLKNIKMLINDRNIYFFLLGFRAFWLGKPKESIELFLSASESNISTTQKSFSNKDFKAYPGIFDKKT
jgi:hypothetical protein